MTCFTNVLPYDKVIRIMDCYLNEGNKIIHRISLGILALKQEALINCKGTADVMDVIKSITSNINIDILFKVAFGFSISKKQILKYEELYLDHIKGRKPGDDDIMAQIQT